MTEIFLDFKKDKNYQISNFGRFYNKKTNKFITPRAGGYEKKYLRVAVSGKDYYLHRIVLEHFFGECPKNKQCAHLDGNPKNNRIDNLKWVYPKENSQHKIIHGTSGKGSKNVMSKLTEQQVIEMRLLYFNGFTSKEIEAAYKIKNCMQIVSGRQWKHVKTSQYLSNKIKEISKQNVSRLWLR